MNPRRLSILDFTVLHERREPRYEPLPYAPWEFWAHFGVLVLVPVALAFATRASTGHATQAEGFGGPTKSAIHVGPSGRELSSPRFGGGEREGWRR